MCSTVSADADESLQSIWDALPSWAAWFQFFVFFSLICLGWGAYGLYTLDQVGNSTLGQGRGGRVLYGAFSQNLISTRLVCEALTCSRLLLSSRSPRSQSEASQLDLTDEQRRLLGLDPLRKKPFVPLIVNKPPPRFEMPPDPREVPHTPVQERIVR